MRARDKPDEEILRVLLEPRKPQVQRPPEQRLLAEPYQVVARPVGLGRVKWRPVKGSLADSFEALQVKELVDFSC